MKRMTVINRVTTMERTTTMKRMTRLFAVAAATLLVSTLALPAAAQDLDERSDESWITIHGTVTTASDHEFMLDHGKGIVRVEMDDWSNDADSAVLSQGDRVTVTGRLDDELFESQSIEALSVYVEDLNTYFYANPMDEEEYADPGARYARRVIGMDDPFRVSTLTIVGSVTEVDGREFTVDIGQQDLTVDTAEMSYNPTDDEGFQRIQEGDRVRVSGRVHSGFFNGRELMAETVVTLAGAM